MTWYYNGAGRRYELPERPLEPPDCWRPKSPAPGILDKKTPAGAANTDEGGVEHVDHDVSASIITQN